MRLPRFKSLKDAQPRSVPKEEIFEDAIELARLRLQQCIADLQDRIRTPEQALSLDGPSTPEETRKVVAA